MANKTVIATARGYLGSLREPGDVFEVPKSLNATWFEDHTPEPEAEFVGEKDPAAPAAQKKGKGKAKAEPATPAPEPVRVTNEINEALGATQPDWVPNAGGDI